MSRIHGLTSRGRILRHVDRFPRCLQEELSEINASVFSTSLIELSSMEPLKLNLSAPISPLALPDIFILNSSSCRFTHLRHAAAPHVFALRRLPFISEPVLLSSSRDGVDALQRRFTIIEIRFWNCCIRPYLVLWKMKAWRQVANNSFACLWPGTFGGTQINGWVWSECRLANTSSPSSKTYWLFSNHVQNYGTLLTQHVSEAASLPWLLLMSESAVTKRLDGFIHSVPMCGDLIPILCMLKPSWLLISF